MGSVGLQEEPMKVEQWLVDIENLLGVAHIVDGKGDQEHVNGHCSHLVVGMREPLGETY